MTMTTLAFFAGPSAQAHSAHDCANRRRLCPKAWAAPCCTTPPIRRASEGQPAARGYANPLGVRSAAAGAAVRRAQRQEQPRGRAIGLLSQDYRLRFTDRRIVVSRSMGASELIAMQMAKDAIIR